MLKALGAELVLTSYVVRLPDIGERYLSTSLFEKG